MGAPNTARGVGEPLMRSPRTMERNRPGYIVGTVIVIALGLLSRKEMQCLPRPIGKDLGDVLYALMAFFVVAAIMPRSSTLKVALAALVFCILVETSKLWHVPLLTAFRGTMMGHLLLGYGFSWSNLVCYVTGVSIGGVFEWGYTFALRPHQFSK